MSFRAVTRFGALACLLLGTAFVAACGGGGDIRPPEQPTTAPASSASPTASPTATPTPLPGVEYASVPYGPSPGAVSFPALPNGLAVDVLVPAATSGTGVLQVAYSASPLAGAPALASLKRKIEAIGGTNLTAFAYLTGVPSTNVTFPGFLGATFTPTAGYTAAPSTVVTYLAGYDPNFPSAGWHVFAGPVQFSDTLPAAFPSTPDVDTLVAGDTYYFVFFTGTGIITV